MLDMLARVLKILDDLGNRDACDAQDEYSNGWDNAISTAYDAVRNLWNEYHHLIKFNDLKDGMWYWDCKAEMYCLCKYSIANENEVIMMYPGDNLRFNDETFEEDRFFVDRYCNPPLKFEDLKDGMWVWDNKTKNYIYIYKTHDWEPIKGIRYASYVINCSVDGYYVDFEENRFYRREIREGE